MEVVGAIVKKLEDPGYLFIIAVLVIVGLFSFTTNPYVAVFVIVVGFAMVLLSTWRDLRRTQGRMSVVLEFPEAAAGSERQLSLCECTIGDPREPQKFRTAQVRPIPAGDGWICPLPAGARPSDVIDFAITDDGGQSWVARGFVLELQWPTIEVREKKAVSP